MAEHETGTETVEGAVRSLAEAVQEELHASANVIEAEAVKLDELHRLISWHDAGLKGVAGLLTQAASQLRRGADEASQKLIAGRMPKEPITEHTNEAIAGVVSLERAREIA